MNGSDKRARQATKWRRRQCLQVTLLWVTRKLTVQIPLYFVSGAMKKRTRDVDILVSGVKYKPNADSIIFDHTAF